MSDMFGAGAATSQMSGMSRREKRTKDVLQMGYEYLRRNRQKEEKEFKKRVSMTSHGDRRRQNEEEQAEREVIEQYYERQEKLQRIGSFKFDIDKELDVEILTSDQVFEDLDDIKNMKEQGAGGDGNDNQAYKSLVMAMYTRGKKKKKR